MLSIFFVIELICCKNGYKIFKVYILLIVIFNEGEFFVLLVLWVVEVFFINCGFFGVFVVKF